MSLAYDANGNGMSLYKFFLNCKCVWFTEILPTLYSLRIIIQIISFDFKKGYQFLQIKQMLDRKYVMHHIYMWTYQTMWLLGADDVDVNEIRLYKFFLNFESVHFALIL